MFFGGGLSNHYLVQVAVVVSLLPWSQDINKPPPHSLLIFTFTFLCEYGQFWIQENQVFCCWLWGWLVLHAWQLCMLVIKHVGSPLPQMCKTNRFASLCLVWLIQFLTDLVTKWCKIKCYFPGNVSMGAWGFCKSPLCKHVCSLSPVSTTPGGGGWLILDLGKIHACTVGFCKKPQAPMNVGTMRV